MKYTIKFYIKYVLKNIILYLIQFIELIEYRKLDLDEDDISKKIIQSNDINLDVESDNGFVNATSIHKTQPYKVHYILLENGLELECADNHIVFDEHYNEVFIKDLEIGDKIRTKQGIQKIVIKKVYKQSISMFDLTIDSEDHRYYTNDILSHNTVVAGIFLVWYFTFHYDKNVMLAGNKGATAKEILDKVKNIIYELPFFLKPPIDVWNAMSIKSDANSRILATTTTEKSAIGFTIHLLFLDEFAHVQQNIQRTFYQNIEPVISASKSSKIIITSTPNGYDLFQELFNNSQKGINDFNSILVPYWKVPGRDEEWAKKRIATLGEDAFNEQYNCSFLKSNSLLIGGTLLKKINDSKSNYVHHSFEILDNYDFIYNYIKWDSEYDVDNIKSDFFILSQDLSEGIGQDYSVMQVLKIVPKSEHEMLQLHEDRYDLYKYFKLKQVGILRTNDVMIPNLSKILYILLFKIFNPNRIKYVLEYNTYGSTLISSLSTAFGSDDYDESIFFTTYHRKGAKCKNIGIKVNKENKPRNCIDLKDKVIKNDIEITEETTIKELGFFQRNKKGSYECATGHDDTIMPLVNAMEVYNSMELNDMIEELYDYLDSDIQDIISKQMGQDIGTDDSLDFLSENWDNKNGYLDPNELGFM